MPRERVTRFQVYDRTYFKYYTRLWDNQFGWSWFKHQAEVFQTQAEAESVIQFLRIFKDHEFIVLKVTRWRIVEQPTPLSHLIAGTHP